MYLSSGTKCYGFIDYFVYVHEKVFAVLKILPISCEDHFGIATPHSFVHPVERDS